MPDPTTRPSRFALPTIAFALLVFAALGTRLYLRATRSSAPPHVTSDAPTASANPTTNRPAAPAASPAIPEAEARRLLGRWVRPDGGYVLEIRKIAPAGSMDVGYFNPAPIHVSRAEGRHDGQTPLVFVELRDANYPGATYTLRYRASEDRLEGEYFQPLAGQTFEVVFVRE